MIRNYIFDLYGTLVDIHTDESMPVLWKRMALFMSLQGASYSPEALRMAYGSAVAKQIEDRAQELPLIPRDHIEPDILLAFNALYADKGVALDRDALWNTALCFRALAMKHISLYPHAIKVLQTLRARGNGVYLLSNAQSAFTVPELHMLGLAPLFDGTVLSSDVGIKKPDRAIFEHILMQYGLEPKSCLMIGNDVEADMLGAASVGMAGRYIRTKQSPCHKSPLPEVCTEIRSLKDLL